KKLKTKKVKVKSVLEDTEQDSISDDIVLIPILRAGLGMTNGFLKVYENAIIAPLGMSRDHETLLPSMYYSNIPENINKCHCFILDPMLATGGSACFAIKKSRREASSWRERAMLSRWISSPRRLPESVRVRVTPISRSVAWMSCSRRLRMKVLCHRDFLAPEWALEWV
ncbi:MAG: hypothetical protein II177_07415, partial [Lachnospiraceae bacterium]|nr:hypothetical protein [Lachnospiraceae bacterium]